ncbi:MAG: DUF1552 domain-containing protein [Planctomycetota bacterium]
MNSISRRTLLRGAGAGIALPLLNAMSPVQSILGKSFGMGPQPTLRRLAMMYIPNGVIGSSWFPKTTGTEFEWTSSLKPLRSRQEDITIISGLSRTYLAGEPHSQAGSCWLTSAKPNERADGQTAIDRTLDQIIAETVGQQTPFPTLELSCNQFEDHAEPKIFDSISWYGPGNNARSMNDPRKVFQRLFGKTQDIKKSVLDTILEDAAALNKKLGRDDRKKMDEYLTSVRAVEQRLSRQQLSRSGIKTVDFEMPEKIPTHRRDFIRLMGDLMILALRTDQTRIATMMVGPERWDTPQVYEGVFDNPINHHVMTHDRSLNEDVAKIDQFHVAQYAYLIDKMKSIQEGDATLLDSCAFVLGSGIGDGAIHSYENLPVVIAGKFGQSIAPGKHIRADHGTPLANLWLTLGNTMGASIESFADSTGQFDINRTRVASREQ